MSEFSSRQRPLASRADILPAEQASARKGIAIALAAFLGMVALILTVAVTVPLHTDTIAMLGP